MQCVYAGESLPDAWSASIFLAGPTPRAAHPVPSWRPAAVQALKDAGFDGVVFIPEDRTGRWEHDYVDQVRWERDALCAADCVLFWVPRDLKTLPAFTTNVEFGLWIRSGKVVFGGPEGAPKNRYLSWLAKEHRVPTHATLDKTVGAAVQWLGEPALREGGETRVPLFLWRAPSFQRWLVAMKQAGNRLDDAELLWSAHIRRRKHPFAWVLRVKVWLEDEQRHKKNEWVLARDDVASVVLHGPIGPDIFAVPIVMVREFRSTVRNEAAKVHEVPSGSADSDLSVRHVACEEVQEEAGLHVEPERLVELGSRQLVATFSAHHATGFAVELTSDELEKLAVSAQSGDVFGVGSERTTLRMTTFGELLDDPRVDWSTVGLVSRAILGTGSTRPR